MKTHWTRYYVLLIYNKTIPKGNNMNNAVTTAYAKSNLSSLAKHTEITHEPIYLKGRYKAVIISKEDYESMKETLYLHSIPGLVESIIEASSSPDDEFISYEEFKRQ